MLAMYSEEKTIRTSLWLYNAFTHNRFYIYRHLGFVRTSRRYENIQMEVSDLEGERATLLPFSDGLALLLL